MPLSNGWVKKGLIGLGVIGIVGTLLSGCPREPKPRETASSIWTSKGIITASLNRHIEVGSAEPFEQFSLIGLFLRYDAEEDPMIVDLFELGAPSLELGLDRCSEPRPVLSEYRKRHSSSGQTAVELLDVGDLTVSVGRDKKLVPTRTFPDLLNVVVGVIYTIDDGQGIDYLPGETYSLHATGTEEVSPFDVVLEAPEDLGDIKVEGAAVSDEVPFITRGDGVALTWEGAEAGDEIIATLSWTKMGAPWSMTCLMRDDGFFVIPASRTRLLPTLTSSDEELTLMRVRQGSFRSTGLSTGSFSFEISTHFPVKF